MIPLQQLFALSEVDGWRLEHHDIGELATDGPISASDAGSVGEPFTVALPAGRWPVEALVGSRSGPEVILAVRSRFSDASVVRWELAVRAGEDPRLLGPGQVYGFPTRTGLAAWRGTDAVTFAAPDGIHPTYVGWDADGAPVELVTDLGLLPVEPPPGHTDPLLRRAEADRQLALLLGHGDPAAGDRILALGEDAAHLASALVDALDRPGVARVLGALLVHAPDRLADVVDRADARALGEVLSRIREARPDRLPPAVTRAALARWTDAPPELQARILDLLALPAAVPGELRTLASRALRSDDPGLLVAALAPHAARVWSSAGRRPLVELPTPAIARVAALALHADPAIRDEAARVLATQGRLDALAPALDDPDPATRRAAATRLGADPRLRERAIDVLVGLAGPGHPTSDRFEAAHAIPDPARRAAAYAALAREGERAALVQLSWLGGEVARSVLRDLAESAPDAGIREEAAVRARE